MKALLLLTSAAAFRERADGTSDHRISTQEPHAWLIRGGSNWDHHFTDAVRVVGTGVVHAAWSALVAIAVGGGRDGGGLSGIFRGMGGGGGGGGGEREGGRVKRAVKTMLEASIAMPCTGHTWKGTVLENYCTTRPVDHARFNQTLNHSNSFPATKNSSKVG